MKEYHLIKTLSKCGSSLDTIYNLTKTPSTVKFMAVVIVVEKKILLRETHLIGRDSASPLEGRRLVVAEGAVFFVNTSLFSRDEATLYEGVSVGRSVRPCVTCFFFGLLGATYALYTALF